MAAQTPFGVAAVVSSVLFEAELNLVTP